MLEMTDWKAVEKPANGRPGKVVKECDFWLLAWPS
jgi:hypothetical protein